MIYARGLRTFGYEGPETRTENHDSADDPADSSLSSPCALSPEKLKGVLESSAS